MKNIDDHIMGIHDPNAPFNQEDEQHEEPHETNYEQEKYEYEQDRIEEYEAQTGECAEE